MDNRIYFSTVQGQLKIVLEDEKIALPSDSFLENLLDFLSRICTYEEEERKIRPNVILGRNVRDALSEVPRHYIMSSTQGNVDGTDLEKIVKALVPFCNNGWFVYIDIGQQGYVEYGVLRGFSGPMGLSVTEILFERDPEDLDFLEYSLVEIKAESKFEIAVTGLRKSRFIIDFRLNNRFKEMVNYDQMAEDITSGYSDKEKTDLEKVFRNILRLVTQRVHGTICLVVKEEFQPGDLLPDGIWLETPLPIAKTALDTLGLESLKEEQDIRVSEMFYGLTGLFLEMMNMDGITVVDNLGRIRAYNVFISQSAVSGLVVSGGARKRAAMALSQVKDPNILGVYFQSQDGNAFYERGGGNEY